GSQGRARRRAGGSQRPKGCMGYAGGSALRVSVSERSFTGRQRSRGRGVNESPFYKIGAGRAEGNEPCPVREAGRAAPAGLPRGAAGGGAGSGGAGRVRPPGAPAPGGGRPPAGAPPDPPPPA